MKDSSVKHMHGIQNAKQDAKQNAKQNAKRPFTTFMAVLMVATLTLGQVPVGYAANDGGESVTRPSAAEVNETPVAQGNDAAHESSSTADQTESAADSEEAVRAATDEAHIPDQAGEIADQTADKTAGQAQEADQFAAQQDAEVALSFTHSYITYDDQIIAPPATKVSLPLQEDFIFSAAADSGYVLDRVQVQTEDMDKPETIEADELTGDYTIEATLLIAAPKVWIIAAENQSEEASIEETDVAAAEDELNTSAKEEDANISSDADDIQNAQAAQDVKEGQDAQGAQDDKDAQSAHAVIKDASNVSKNQASSNKENLAGMNQEETTLTAKAADGMVATMVAPAGTIPEGSTLEAVAIASDVEAEGALAAALMQDGRQYNDIKLYDITLRDANGREVEPAGTVSVTFERTGVSQAAGDTVEVFHIPDAQAVIEKVATDQDGSEQSFETASFSLYAAAATSAYNPVYIGASNAAVEYGIYRTASDRLNNANAITDSTQVSVGDNLYGKIKFDFKAGTGPTTGRLTYAYTLPDNIEVADKQLTTLYDTAYNVAGQWMIQDNTVYFFYNEAWALSHPDGGGNFSFDFQLNEEKVRTGSNANFNFPGATSTVTVTIKEGDVTGTKTNTAPDADGYVTYTVTLHAQDDFSSFKFSDTLESSLKFVDSSFTLDGAHVAAQVTEGADGSSVATLTGVSSLSRGDHTITYKAKVDPGAYAATGNGQNLAHNKNTAKWEFGKNGLTNSHQASTWVYVNKNLLNKWAGNVYEGNKIKWTVQINASSQYKVDLAGYTFTDTLKEGHTYGSSFELQDANGKKIKDVSIKEGSSSFTYTFDKDAGAKKYYIVYYTTITDATKAAKLSNEGTITPPSGKDPTTVQSTKDYNPDSGNTGGSTGTGTGGTTTPGSGTDAPGGGTQPATPDPTVSKEVFDSSEALTEGIVTWHATVSANLYPDEEYLKKNAQGFQYYDSLESWNNKHARWDSNEYATIWFVGEPRLYANGVELVNGQDYEFDAKSTDYGYCSYTPDFSGEKVPTALKIKFLVDGKNMAHVIANKTPIDIYYDTQCDGTTKTYDNVGYAQLVNQWSVVYSNQDKAEYTLNSGSRVLKTGTMSFDKTRHKYVASWNVLVNRGDSWEVLSDLHSPTITIKDELPEGLKLIDGTATAHVRREGNAPGGFAEAYVDPAVDVDDTTAMFTVDVTQASLPSWQAPFYDSATGSCWVWIELTFQTELDPAYVDHDGASHSLGNTAVAESAGVPLGTGHGTVTYSDKVLEKSGYQEAGAPVVHYTIKVNPNGEKLDPEATHTVINLNDQLDYRTTVVLSSIKVSHNDTGEDITSQCNVSLDNSAVDAQGHTTSAFSVAVPDETPVKVEYDVSIAGPVGSSQEISNTASLEGVSSEQTETRNWYKVNQSDANVYGAASIITITKTDSSDALTTRLQGAQFELYQVDMAALPDGGYTDEQLAAASTRIATAESDATGVAVLMDPATQSLLNDTLYYFKEVTAPNGYAIDDDSPHFIMLQGANYNSQLYLARTKGIVPSLNLTYNFADTQKAAALLTATKVLEGADLHAGQFTFELVEDGKVLQTATNDGNGKVEFENIVYSAAGVHTYIIREVTGTDQDIAYDKHEAKATVTVTKGSAGSYNATVAYESRDANTFTNTVNATGEAQLFALKTLSGKKLDADAFSFELLQEGKVIQTAKNDASGKATFQPIEYSLADVGKTYSYTIKEVLPETATAANSYTVDGITYDTTEHTVHVAVANNGDGTLKITYDGVSETYAGAVFANSYTATGSTVFAGTKSLTGGTLEEGAFSFTLQEGTSHIATVQNKADGTIAFPKLSYTLADVGTHTYTVSEVAGTTAGITYDDTVYTVTVKVKDTGKGTLSVEASDNASALNFTNTVETTEIAGVKTWDDANNQDGIRPDAVTIRLLANGKEIDSVDVTSNGDGAYSFENLPVYADGKRISYTVAEDAVQGYTASVQGFDITNTHTPETVVFTGTKTWTDEKNQDGIRPAHIKIKLLADGKAKDEITVAPNAAGSWSYAFTDLPKYSNGKEIIYSVQELPVDGYTVVYGDTGALTNTHTVELRDISGKKTWNDTNDQDGMRPESITVHLLANGQEVASTTATAQNKWTYSFSNMPVNANGKALVYTVIEDAVPGYTTKIDGFDIQNTHTPQKTQIQGTKFWMDGSDQDGLRPDKITVRLLADGAEVASAEVTAKDNWQYAFTDMPVYGAGKKIEYTVAEVEVPGYTSTVEGFDITNVHVPTQFGLSGKKTWNDADDQDGMRPEKITVMLLADGEEVARQDVTPNENGTWTYNFPDMPEKKAGKAIEYTVKEVAVDGYTATYDGLDIVNTHKTKTVDVSGTKTWEDANDQDGMRPEKITVMLLADGEEVARQDVTPNENGTWIYNFPDMPEKKAGKTIEYTVKEVAVDGYTATYDGLDIVNTHKTKTVDVSGKKTWKDADDQDGIRPECITVHLLADGEEVDSADITAANNWKYSFTDLPAKKAGKTITYTVSEDAVDGYKTAYEGFDITNTHTPETVEVSGTKTWKDADDQDGIRPESITVHLLADGEEVDAADITAANNWKYSFTDLPAKKAGKTITYTVSEDTVKGYTTKVEGFDITNTHKPATTNVSGKKTWRDDSDRDGVRPDTITVILTADGNPYLTKTVSAQNNWDYEFNNVPEYQSGKKITYAVIEEPVDGYVAQYEGTNITNTHTPGKVNISGIKTWSDANNQDGIRPDSITVRLYANGKEVDSTCVTPDKNDVWSYAFTDLPEKDKGKTIEYTVSEDAVPGYTANIDGFTISNTHTPATTNIAGVKTWNDANDQDGIRPDAVAVTLSADGTPVKTVKANEASNWTYSFSDLPVYKAGKLVTYTVSEESVEGYTATYDGANITNTHKPATTEISGSKTWADQGNQDGIRPDTITVRLLADGSEVAAESVSADSDWRYAFTDLPVYNAGKAITYTVSEDKVEGYATSYDGFTIRNAHTPETIEVAGTKTWADVNNQDGIRPDNVTVHLFADGEEVDAAEVSEANNWKYSFTNLPAKKAGKTITYTVSEDAVNGYTTTYNGFDITNTHTPETVNVSGTKTWKDANNQDGIRPESITVHLLADGEEVDVNEVTAASDWGYSFTDLPAKKAGKTITYTVSEDVVDGYTTAYDDFDITNTHTPETVEVAGSKTWEDANNQDGIRPESITVTLLANGTPINTTTVTQENGWKYSFVDLPAKENGTAIEYTIAEQSVEGYAATYDGFNITNTHVPGEVAVSGSKLWEDNADQDGIRPDSVKITLLADGTPVDTATVTAEDGWKYSFTELPAKKAGKTITYTVSETAVEGYTTTYNGFDITNTHTPETTEVAGTKTWVDANNQDGMRPDTVTVHLLADGEEVDATDVSEASDWKYSFTDLPVKKAGKTITYTVSETAVEGYAATYNGFDITNTHTPETVEVAGIKTWEDANNQDGMRPDTIVVHVCANGEVVRSQSVSAADDGTWAFSFADLPKYENGEEIVYTVTEEPVDGYTTSLTGTAEEGFTLVNTHTPQTIAISGTKVWADDSEELRPATIQVTLLANGAEVASRTVAADASGNWAYAFNNMPAYAEGKRIQYSLAEQPVDGYTAALEGSVEEGFTLTNTHLAHTAFTFKKYRYGVDGNFQFQLASADAQGNQRDGEVRDLSTSAAIADDGQTPFEVTVQNEPFSGSSAAIKFPDITFAADGTYYYTVREITQSTDEMTADEALYLVRVEVANGAVASTHYELFWDGASLGQTDDLSFYNNGAVKLGMKSMSMASYTDAAKRISVYPEVHKRLNGSTDALAGGEFQFQLVNPDSGEVIATASNDENGDVAFFSKDESGLVFTQAGTYSYLIREVAGDDASVTYDTSTITCSVVVSEAQDGLHATTTYSGATADTATFQNMSEGFDVTVQKVSRSGGEGLADCTYALWMVGPAGDVLVQEAVSDKDGYITFTNVSLLAGQRYYFKEVEAPSGHTVDPYRTAYFALNEDGTALVLVEDTAADGWHSALDEE